MKALTVLEPYATPIRLGIKHYETRSWKTNYRGPLLIHAGKKDYPSSDKFWDFLVNECNCNPFRKGVFHCKAILSDCIYIDQEFIDSLSEIEKKLGFYEVGRYAWLLEDIEPFDINKQTVINGHQGLWNFEL